MNCLEGVKPIYYVTENYTGLAVEPYQEVDGEFIYDEVRAFIVMKFPYIFPETETEPEEIDIVTQAFYRSSGSNSQAQFGDNITDEDAKGTWIPTNGLVVKSGYREHGVCVLNNNGYILKQPFVDLATLTLLSRFHGDPQLALISYIMGGGIWNNKSKVKELSTIFKNKGFPDYTKKFKSGCIELSDELVPALAVDINRYIGDSVSWNWHPLDIEFLTKSALEKVDLNDNTLWIENEGRHFIPENIFLNPGVIRNFKTNPLTKRFGPEKAKEIFYKIVVNNFKTCPWSENSPTSMYPRPPNP